MKRLKTVRNQENSRKCWRKSVKVLKKCYKSHNIVEIDIRLGKNIVKTSKHLKSCRKSRIKTAGIFPTFFKIFVMFHHFFVIFMYYFLWKFVNIAFFLTFQPRLQFFSIIFGNFFTIFMKFSILLQFFW